MQKKLVSLSLTAVMVFGMSSMSFAGVSMQPAVPVSAEATAVKTVSTWRANSTYQVGDQVTYEGNLYVCKVAHFKLKPTTAYVWTCMGAYKAYPDWVKGKKYVAGDKVSYNGQVYECIFDHVRLSPTTAYVWKVVK